MVDSESVAVGGEVAAGVTDGLVVNEAGGEREKRIATRVQRPSIVRPPRGP
jgi:hypothetical protein